MTRRSQKRVCAAVLIAVAALAPIASAQTVVPPPPPLPPAGSASAPVTTVPATPATTPQPTTVAPPSTTPATPTTDPSSCDNDTSLACMTKEARVKRCALALCWGGLSHTKWGIEPLVELPIGKSFSPFQTGAVAEWINSHDFSATFAGGLRFMLFEDAASVAVYFSKPVTSNGDIRVQGSPFLYTESHLHRPYPGVALGLFQDVVWVGFDLDELRNGDSDSSSDHDPAYPRNAVVSRSLTTTIAFAPIDAIRTGLGLKPSSTSSSSSTAPPAPAPSTAPAGASQ